MAKTHGLTNIHKRGANKITFDKKEQTNNTYVAGYGEEIERCEFHKIQLLYIHCPTGNNN